jgi:hypothetical protein
MEVQVTKKTWKQKLYREFTEYWVNVAYLTLFFCVFAIARRLTLSHYGVEVQDYFVGIIKALVIAKVIMIGAFLRISRKYENKPLIIPVLYKTILFVLWVILFDVIEGFIRGLVDTKSLTAAIDFVLQHHFTKLWLGGLLFVSLSFIPFFALKELARVIGHEKFKDLFF